MEDVPQKEYDYLITCATKYKPEYLKLYSEEWKTPAIITSAVNQNLKDLPTVYEMAKDHQDLQQAILYADLEIMNQRDLG